MQAANKPVTQSTWVVIDILGYINKWISVIGK